MALDLSSPLKVVSWASVHADCPVRYTINGADEMVVVFGSGSNEFELSLDAGALHTLAMLTAEAVAKLDTSAEEQPSELASAGERST